MDLARLSLSFAFLRERTGLLPLERTLTLGNLVPFREVVQQNHLRGLILKPDRAAGEEFFERDFSGMEKGIVPSKNKKGIALYQQRVFQLILKKLVYCEITLREGKEVTEGNWPNPRLGSLISPLPLLGPAPVETRLLSSVNTFGRLRLTELNRMGRMMGKDQTDEQANINQPFRQEYSSILPQSWKASLNCHQHRKQHKRSKRQKRKERLLP
ncbi:hypothetical protein ACFE04_019680 [Oxalis oulophora]